MLEYDLQMTAFRIADEASVSLLENAGIRIDHVTIDFGPEELADPIIEEAIDYLVGRKLAHKVGAQGDHWHVILETDE